MFALFPPALLALSSLFAGAVAGGHIAIASQPTPPAVVQAEAKTQAVQEEAIAVQAVADANKTMKATVPADGENI